MATYDNLIGATPLTAAPRYMADLRPSADAAATRTETRPATTVAVAAVAPPSPTQAGEVSKSAVMALRAVDKGGAATADANERRLKPYGVVMLPHGTLDEKPDTGADPRSSADRTDPSASGEAVDLQPLAHGPSRPADLNAEGLPAVAAVQEDAVAEPSAEEGEDQPDNQRPA